MSRREPLRSKRGRGDINRTAAAVTPPKYDSGVYVWKLEEIKNARNAQMKGDFELPARLAGQVRPGMTVVVALPGETAKGQILSVGAQLDPATNSVHAEATVAGANGLIPGKGVMAVVNGDPAGSERGIAVPAKAVVRIAGQDFVFVRTGKRFERRAVAVAAEAAGSAVLSGGVRPGERVAVSGVAELKSLLAGQ